ncbi:hypothetical protein [Nocardiopsis algeriensis]|uniref:Uncharacterized protein n=1 Tax=Nocardiopsis algeriensis TaxID=1478215 RepID=A0A841IRV6_9ACTN|nr:hypothetical protein [Nocardiopsis algeriensis]MBB6120862.1 hypothetical protein [Nocardiopsis algeriensis]
MVLAEREWPAHAAGAVRVDRALCARLFFLLGVFAVAWLVGGTGVASGETASGGLADSVLGAGADGVGRTVSRMSAEEPGTSDGKTEKARSASRAVEGLADTLVPSALEETRTGEAAAGVVGETANGTGELFDGIARTGREIVGTADTPVRDGGLVESVVEGLDEPALAADRPDDTRNAEAPETPRTEGDDRAPEPGDGTGPSEEKQAERVQLLREQTAAAFQGTGAQGAEPWTGSAEAPEQAETGGSAERIHLSSSGAHHQSGADSTGTAAPSFPAPGAAGFLTARADHLAPRAHRVALPGDPTLVVRDAADDPTFSPD